MKNVTYILWFLIFLSCTQSQPNQSLEIKYPSHFPSPNPSPNRNPLTLKGVELGRRLFFDKNMSGSGEVSCASCHMQQLSFADGVAHTSAGSTGIQLKRNSPALINLAWMDHFFWDGGVKNLESLPFAALTNPNEMGADLNDKVAYLNSDSVYRELFRAVFDVDSISSAYVARALAQFQRTLVSANSLYDKIHQGKASFSEIELAGEKVFSLKCASCHVPPLFTDNKYHNTGLDSIFPTQNEDVRAGRYRITLDSSDLGKFKTPTLRNLKWTGPYMHDGRFVTLEEALLHYKEGIKVSNTLDARLQNFELDINEINSLLSFLALLNDEEFTRDKRYSPPL